MAKYANGRWVLYVEYVFFFILCVCFVSVRV